jgi:hypothetical protein
MKVDVYPVGVLHDLRVAWRIARDPRLRRTRHAHLYLRHAWRAVSRHVRKKMWRELKNDLNGYLAEPTPWPEGVTRCGSGWTPKRALRSLRRQVRRPGVRWEEVDREIVKVLAEVGR